MKSKSLNFIIFLLFTCNISFGQESGEKNSFEEKIRVEIEDESSVFFYPKLLNKIQEHPDKITKEDIKYLYYGQIYKAGTSLSFLDNKNEDSFRRALAQNNCKKIFLYGYSNLKENPVLLTTLIPTNNCRLKINEPDSNFLDSRTKMLLEVIFDTGNGKTRETAIKISTLKTIIF